MEGTRASHETGAVMIQTVSKNSPYLAHRLLNSCCTKNSSLLSLAATIGPNFGWSWNCVCRWYHLEGHTLRPVRAGAYLIFVTTFMTNMEKSEVFPHLPCGDLHMVSPGRVHASTCPGWWCAYLIFDAICCQEKNQTYREWPFGVHCTLYMYIYGNTPPLALGKSFVGPPGARGYISQYIPPLGSVRIDYLFIWNMKMFFIGMRRGLIWVKLGEFQKYVGIKI